MRVERDNSSFKTRFTTVMISSSVFFTVFLSSEYGSVQVVWWNGEKCARWSYITFRLSGLYYYVLQDNSRFLDVCACQLPITCSWRFFNSVVFLLFKIIKQTSPLPPDLNQKLCLNSITYKLANKRNKQKTVFYLVAAVATNLCKRLIIGSLFFKKKMVSSSSQKLHKITSIPLCV